MPPEEIEQFRHIPGFPTYRISSFGRVLNHLGIPMALVPNPEGIITVGLYADHKQHRRSVKVLVARAFVPGETLMFNTPIQLDGDYENCRADNIVWRPRWFAWRYTRQFRVEYDWYYAGPIIDRTNNVVYENILAAAVETGSLCEHIHRAVMGGYRVFPNGEEYSWY